jgi:pimeloyl-ACP methyl ester carboxylesterase
LVNRQPTSLLRLPGGVRLEYLSTGTGPPVTLFLPGLGGGIPDTRVLGSGVPGTKVFLQLRGHGRSSAPGVSWRYADLAGDAAAAADAVGASRALGVSMGAGALCRLVAGEPDRFDRLVVFLPAVLDAPRPGPALARIRALASALASGSREAVADVVSAEVPEAFRGTSAARSYLTQRVSTLLDGGLAGPVASLADGVAVDDVMALRRVRAPVLVLACRGDELHPVEVAERLAAVLPNASLHVYDEPGVLWTHRADLRSRIAGFLAA